MPRRDYQSKLNADNAGVLERSRNTRDIAPGYPPPGDLVTREACEEDLRRFCETYFANAFNLPWSKDHLQVINRMETVILDGGLFALAMPRGSGKSTLTVRAALWALLYGHRRFVSLVGATEDHARKLLRHFKTELMLNDRLYADFRQVCYPIRRLENNGRKCIGQLFDGAQTRIDWSDDRLTFPTMPDSACDGVNVSSYTISVAGLTGAIRGQSHTLPDGTIVRPEVVILDDPQTRESAMSTVQSRTRAEIIQGDVLGMAGPDQKISAIMPCTVICPDDMAATMLDRKKNPEWCGQKTKMVYSFPASETLWEEYRRIREEGFIEGTGGGAATDFYRDHRAEMDAGAVLAWPERFAPGEVSAVQHAMNLRFRDERAFFAEYQNEPLPEAETRTDDLTPDQITARVNRIPRGHLPTPAQRITAFIDVHGTVLYWLAVAWEDDFSGYLLDYGVFPEQKRAYFLLRDAKPTLADAVKGAALEGQIYGGLELLTADILAREWPRDDGAALKIERCLIDANWGLSTAVVKKFCRQSPFSAVLTPSHGKYIGASGAPMAEWQKRPGDRLGLGWRQRSMEDSKAVRSVLFDANYWKSFAHARLSSAMGDRGALTLFGDRPDTHTLLADHYCAEFRVRVEGRGRTVDEWKQRPERMDNHWWDCLVGCYVGASMQGVALPETVSGPAAGKTKYVSFADLKRKRA